MITSGDILWVLFRPTPQERAGRNTQQKFQAQKSQSQHAIGSESEDDELVGVYKQQTRGQRSPANDQGKQKHPIYYYPNIIIIITAAIVSLILLVVNALIIIILIY